MALRLLRAPRALAATGWHLRNVFAASRASLAHRPLCSKAEPGKTLEVKKPDDAVVEVKRWGSGLELKEVTKKEAEEAYLEATSVKRALTPPVSVAVEARDDMLNNRFEYVKTNLNPASQYVVMGSKGKIAPQAVGQTGMLLGSMCVLMAAITTGVYIKTQWGVSSPKELGDKLREKGAARREEMEKSGTVHLARTLSRNMDATVKENVELVRRPSQQMGEHFQESFKGVVRKRPGAEAPKPEPAA